MSSSEAPRHWRLRQFRYRLAGWVEQKKDGQQQWRGLAHFAEGRIRQEKRGVVRKKKCDG